MGQSDWVTLYIMIDCLLSVLRSSLWSWVGMLVFVGLELSGLVAKVKLGRLPIRLNGGRGTFGVLVARRIRHFTYTPNSLTRVFAAQLGRTGWVGQVG